MSRKSWADQQGIKTGVLGETINGITIAECNRATTYEDRRGEIEVLRSILQTNYRSKGVKAVLFGIEVADQRPKYAVFVEAGFLQEVGINDE